MRVDGKYCDESHIIISEYGVERRELRKQNIIMLADEIFAEVSSDVAEDILLLADNGKDIKLIISSPGGEVDNGLVIIDAISYAQAKGVRVIGDVWGMAASMAATILQYTDERIISKHGWLMNHGAQGITIGDIKDAKAELIFKQGVMEQFAKQYAMRNTSQDEKYKSVEYWQKKFEEKTPDFITAQQALQMGLVDKIR